MSIFTDGDKVLEGMVNWGIWIWTKFKKMPHLLVGAGKPVNRTVQVLVVH